MMTRFYNIRPFPFFSAAERLLIVELELSPAFEIIIVNCVSVSVPVFDSVYISYLTIYFACWVLITLPFEATYVGWFFLRRK